MTGDPSLFLGTGAEHDREIARLKERVARLEELVRDMLANHYSAPRETFGRASDGS